jgi:hypothetical protein
MDDALQVRLVPRDHHSAIVVPLEDARSCQAIVDALDSSACSDAVVPLPLIDAKMLRHVLSAARGSETEIEQRLAAHGPKMDELEVFCAASYLEADRLLRVLTKRLAGAIAAALGARPSDGGADAHVAALRAQFGVPDDLPPAAAAAAASESPLTPEGPPPASGAPAERCCRLASLPGGDDLLDECFAQCGASVLSAVKRLSKGWRRAARRVMTRPTWQAAMLSVGDLLELGAEPQVVCARLRTADGAADASRKLEQFGAGHRRLPLHVAASRAASDTAAHGAAVAEERWLPVLEALLRAHPKGAEARDLDGFTPMHLAAAGAVAPAMLRLLFDAYDIVGWQKVWKVMAVPARGGASEHAFLDTLEAEYRHIGRLPLHCCAAGPAALPALEFLLAAWPPAIKELDAVGRTPLHLACMGTAPEASIDALMRAHRDAAAVEDKRAMLPLQYALETRPHDTRVLQLLAGATPNGAGIMAKFFMDRLKLDGQALVLLANALARDKAGAGAPGGLKR